MCVCVGIYRGISNVKETEREVESGVIHGLQGLCNVEAGIVTDIMVPDLL